MSVIRKVCSCNEMWFLWACYVCIAVGLLCYVRQMVFTGRMEEVVVRLSNTSQLQPGKVSDNPTETAAAPIDIFDFCPFEPPDPWDKTIVMYLNDKYGFISNCTAVDNLQPVTDLASGKVLLKKGKEKFQCQARCIEYVADNEYTLSNWSAINGTVFNCDFVETNCKMGNTTNRHIHMQTAEQKPTSQNKLDPQKHPDVHLMVIDSVSSSQVIRGLPRTINFLTHGMGAVEFRKFNMVGLNSRPNAFPLLMGKTIETVTRKPMNLPSVQPDWSYNEHCKRYLDDEPYIPLEYEKLGYKTLGAEDFLGSILHYPYCKAMKRRQFHHIYRPFHTRLEKDEELKNIHLKGSCQKEYSHMLNYLSTFVNAYRGLPKFSLTWMVDLTHDDTRRLYDSDYEIYSFFLKNRDALNNSFIFFLGDHGPRIGSEAYTKFNYRERKNPFLYVVMPALLRSSRIHDQLLTNSQEIVTPHDVHTTLKDILYDQPSSFFNDVSFKKFESSPHGSSLLRQFESGIKRTCKTLPIPFQYCICQYKMVAVSDKNLEQTGGKLAVDGLVATLDSHNVSSKCEKISLNQVIAVEKYTLPNENVNFESNLYEVVFNVSKPALGKFKVHIRDRGGGRFELAADQINRLDSYGHHGDCMTVGILQPLCTCKK